MMAFSFQYAQKNEHTEKSNVQNLHVANINNVY